MTIKKATPGQMRLDMNSFLLGALCGGAIGVTLAVLTAFFGFAHGLSG